MKHNWKDIAAKILTSDTAAATITTNYSNRNKSVLVTLLVPLTNQPWFMTDQPWFRLYYDKDKPLPFVIVCEKGLIGTFRYVEDAIEHINAELVKYIL